MSWLLDTNVLSELRKGARGDPRVAAWWEGARREGAYLSVLTLGEIRKGTEAIRPRDPDQAVVFERWLAQVEDAFADRILTVDATVAEVWGRIAAMRTVPVVDALLGATAQVHGLVLATRDRDVRDLGIPVLNPFEAPDAR